MCCKDEYLMLREEILHVDTMKNNTLNFMYALIGVVLSFSLTQSDNLYTLVIYVVLLPSYAIILGQERTRCKIGTYLLIFHEENGSDFQWERRQIPFYRSVTKNNTTIFGRLEAFNFPFLFLSLFATTIFFIKTDWLNIDILYEKIKIFICLILFIIMCVSIFINHKGCTENYREYWEKVKEELGDSNENSSSEAMKLL